MPNISVVEALKAYRGDRLPDGTYPFPDGLYKETGRIAKQTLKTLTATGETKEHEMAQIDYLDIKTFADEMDVALKRQNEYVQELFAKNAVGMVNLIRAVCVESGSGFKGSVGSGRQLDAIMLRAEQLQDPDVALGGLPGRRASWIRTITPAMVLLAAVNFIEADWGAAGPHGVALPMATTEGFALLGFANPAAALCVDAVQITYIGQQYNIQNLDFELANPFIGDAIVELKQPLYIFPQESALVTVNYYRAGTDELRPIGLWVKMSQNLRLLLTD